MGMVKALNYRSGGCVFKSQHYLIALVGSSRKNLKLSLVVSCYINVLNVLDYVFIYTMYDITAV